jgi:hypothetical protein
MQQTAACDDCVVGVMLNEGSPIEFADAELAALDHLAEAGLVSPIRLVSRSGEPEAATG